MKNSPHLHNVLSNALIELSNYSRLWNDLYCVKWDVKP